MKVERKSSRLKKRISVCEAIYSNLVLAELNEKLSNSNYDKSSWGGFEKKIFKRFLKKKEEFLLELGKLLREDWTTERLNLIILAVLLEAMAEYGVFKTSPAVLLHQAILIAQEYGEDDYKLVHAVIDNYLKQKLESKTKS